MKKRSLTLLLTFIVAALFITSVSANSNYTVVTVSKINLLSAITGQDKDDQDKKLSVLKGNVNSNQPAEYNLTTEGYSSGSLKARLFTDSSMLIVISDKEGNVLASQEVTPDSPKVTSVDFSIEGISEISIRINGEGSYILLPTSNLE